MKKYQLLTALALAVSFGAVAPVATSATAGDTEAASSVVAQTEATHVKTNLELANAIKNPDVTHIILDQHISSFYGANNIGWTIDIKDRELTIDLNGYNITSPANAIDAAIAIKSGTVTFTGTGHIISQATRGVPAIFTVYGSDDPAAENYTVVNIGPDVVLTQKDASEDSSIQNYAIAVMQTDQNHAYGVVINHSGQISNTMAGIYVHGNIKDLTGNFPVININDGAVIDTRVTGLYAAGYAKWNLGAANLNGGTGLSIKSGDFVLTNTSVTADGEDANPKPEGSGIYAIGAAIQIEQNKGYAGNINLTINSGNYSSLNNSTLLVYTDGTADSLSKLQAVAINGGSFAAQTGQPVIQVYQPEDPTVGTVPDQDIITITDGQFTSKVAAYVVDGKTLVAGTDDAGNSIWYVANGVFDPGIDAPANPDEGASSGEEAGNEGVDVVAPDSGAISAAQHTYFTNASAIWAGVAVLTVAGAIIVTCRRADKRA